MKDVKIIALLLALGLAVRLAAFAFIDFMFTNDVHTFQVWGTQLATYGLSHFYTGGMWSDYPPGYLYVLALIGRLRLIFEWELLSPILNFFTFLPAMLADVAISYVLWRITGKVWVAALWLFNPAILLISSVWGQVESVFLLPLVISLWLVREKKLLGAYVLYGAAILIKPQSLFLGPVFLFSAIDYWRENNFAGVELKRLALYIGAAALGMLLLAFPFARGLNFLPVFEQFWGGLDMYNFGSVNAFNAWALAGRNWQPLDATFLGLSHGVWGVVIAVVIVLGIMAALEYDRRRGGTNFWLIAAAVFLLTFVFSVKMHERYLFPAILFLLLHAAEKPRWHSFALFGVVSITFFVNCYAVLYAFNGDGNWWEAPMLTRWMNQIAWLNIGAALGMIAMLFIPPNRPARRKRRR